MSSSRVATPVGRLLERGSWTGQPDGRLLDRYARLGDREAFEVLASRHGPMVMGVCRRILVEPSDVDDAFQATFLVLIRRASSLGPGDVLSAWLHGVATKVARRARMDRARRRARERDGLGVESRHEPVPPDFALRELIDEEVERLPWKYRAPVALCYLEGLTHEEAADRLGWPVGSVKGRLARARTLLGSRLARRGVTAGAGALALEGLASAAVTEAQVNAVAVAAGRVAAGLAWKSVLSCQVVDLARGACTPMIASKSTSAALAAAAIVLAAAGAGVAAARPDGREPAANPPTVIAAATPPPPVEIRVPAPSPVPPKVQADRLLIAARGAFQAAVKELESDDRAIDRVYRASRLWLDAEEALATDPEARRSAYASHTDRMRRFTLAGFVKRPSGDASARLAADAIAMVAEAELLASRSESGGPATASAPVPTPGPDPAPTSSPAGASDGLGDGNPRTATILKQLDEPLAMNFPNDTPLEDVLKYIKEATQASPGGIPIPIYVEPSGLQQTDKTTTSPVTMNIEGVPLRRTLHLMLKQLGLVYYVEDGLLVVTSPEGAESGMGADRARPSRRLEEIARAERGELTTQEMQALAEKLKLIDEVRKAAKTLEPHPVGNGTPGFQ